MDRVDQIKQLEKKARSGIPPGRKANEYLEKPKPPSLKEQIA